MEATAHINIVNHYSSLICRYVQTGRSCFMNSEISSPQFHASLRQSYIPMPLPPSPRIEIASLLRMRFLAHILAKMPHSSATQSLRPLHFAFGLANRHHNLIMRPSPQLSLPPALPELPSDRRRLQFCTHLLIASFRLSLAPRTDSPLSFLFPSSLHASKLALEFHGIFATSAPPAIYLSLKKKKEKAITCP